MYNEKIESLIKAALADGMLTEKEKQILFKRAQAEGIDLDEFEMVLDARIVDIKQKTKTAMPKSNKQGEVYKCPACGEIIPFLVGVCPTCGHTFDLTQTDVELIKKLETDCQELSRIKNSGMPILIALNIIYIGIAILFVIMDIDQLGTAILGIFFFGNGSLGWIFPALASQDDEQTGKLSSSKLDNYVFNIRSKIKSTKYKPK